MIKNTWRAGITAAAGTRLTHVLIRLVVNTIINYPSPKTEAAHKIRNKVKKENVVTSPGLCPVIL